VIRPLTFVVALATLLFAASASAESVASLKKKLLNDGDFRVRTQAALALGASRSKKAVSPLCSGLDDKSDTVRAASAAGLGRLQRGGKSCLEKRKKSESSNNVKKMISKALRLLDEAASGPTLGGSTKYYLAFGKVNARSGRAGEIKTYTTSSMKKALSRKRGFAFAPAGESTKLAKKRLRKHPRVAGYYFETDVLVEYSGRDLVVELKINVFGYPDKQSQGSLSQMTGYSGLSGKDPDKENELIDQVVKKAMGKFASMAASVD
jgi:hypothetical protein